MRDHTKLRAFTLADEVVLLIYKSSLCPAPFPEKSQFKICPKNLNP